MIYLDNIIFSLQKAGGISVVWAEHLSKMVQNKQNFYVLERSDAHKNIFRQNLIIPRERIIDTKNIPLILDRYLNPSLSTFKGGIFHSSYFRVVANRKIKNVTTVHDFTYEYYSSYIKRTLHCSQKYYALRHSDAIICISENTKKDLLKFLPDFTAFRSSST